MFYKQANTSLDLEKEVHVQNSNTESDYWKKSKLEWKPGAFGERCRNFKGMRGLSRMCLLLWRFGNVYHRSRLRKHLKHFNARYFIDLFANSFLIRNLQSICIRIFKIIHCNGGNRNTVFQNIKPLKWFFQIMINLHRKDG